MAVNIRFLFYFQLHAYVNVLILSMVCSVNDCFLLCVDSQIMNKSEKHVTKCKRSFQWNSVLTS